MPRLDVYREPQVTQPRNSHARNSSRHSSHELRTPESPAYKMHHRHSRRNDEHTKAPGRHQLTTMQAHMVAFSGEFVGTFMFLYFSFACHLMLVRQSGETSLEGRGASSQQNVFTALVYGFSLLVNVWAFYRISGGLFNPAVTLGLVIAGGLPPIRGLILFPAQLLAAMCAGGLVSAMFPGDISLTTTSLSPETSVVQGLFIEMFMTAELTFVVLMLAVEKSKDTFIAPIGIGLALFVAMLGGVFYTGGSLNPARSLGPAVAGTSFVGYHWIYWLGPFMGGALAALYYKFVKAFNYEQANPGQDSADGDFAED